MGESGRGAWGTRRAGRHVAKEGVTFFRVFRILLIVGGVLGLAGLSLVVSSFGSSVSSTTSIPPGPIWYMYYQFTVLGAGTLRGDYQETTGGSVILLGLTGALYETRHASTRHRRLLCIRRIQGGNLVVRPPGCG